MGMKKKQYGFTLIEMIIVIVVIGLVLPALISVLFTVVRQQAKIIALQEIKNQGDNAISSIETVIKSQAIGIYSTYLDPDFSGPQCNTTGAIYSSSTGDDFYFKDKNGKQFHFYLNNVDPNDPYIASQSALSASVMKLNNSRVQISGFSISCKKTATYSAPIVTISFKVAHKEGSSMNYQTRIKLRNY